jgi:hypothetical protein
MDMADTIAISGEHLALFKCELREGNCLIRQACFFMSSVSSLPICNATLFDNPTAVPFRS